VGRGFWLGLFVLIAASIVSFVIAGRLAGAGACDTVWDCSEAGVAFLAGIVFAILAFAWAVAWTVRADRGRRDRRF
jgi:hypothetical protein